MEKMNFVSEHALTHQHLEKLKKEVEKVRIKNARRCISECVDSSCSKHDIKNKKMVNIGRYSEEILESVENHGIDLVVLEFINSFLLNYEIFEKSPVPVWIEGVD